MVTPFDTVLRLTLRRLDELRARVGEESAECMRLQAELAELAGTYRAELLRPCALDDGALPADGFRQLCRARRTALAREVDAAEQREAATRRAAAELLGEHHALAQAAERYRAELRRAADRREQTRADEWAGAQFIRAAMAGAALSGRAA